MSAATWLESVPPFAAYALAALILAAEGLTLAGMFVPGTATVLALGHLSASGVVQPVCAVICAATAALLGDTLGFAAGRRARTRNGVPARLARLQARLPGRLSRTPPVPALLATRWFTGPRTLVPRLVGLGPTTYLRFAGWAGPAAVAWALGLVLAGRWIGTGLTAALAELPKHVPW